VTRQIPAAYKQPGSFLEQDKQKIIGQVCIAPIKKDEQILTTKLAEGKEQSLASILAATGERRTVTIAISAWTVSHPCCGPPTTSTSSVSSATTSVGGRWRRCATSSRTC